MALSCRCGCELNTLGLLACLRAVVAAVLLRIPACVTAAARMRSLQALNISLSLSRRNAPACVCSSL